MMGLRPNFIIHAAKLERVEMHDAYWSRPKRLMDVTGDGPVYLVYPLFPFILIIKFIHKRAALEQRQEKQVRQSVKQARERRNSKKIE
jgi:hypothetical protein